MNACSSFELKNRDMFIKPRYVRKSIGGAKLCWPPARRFRIRRWDRAITMTDRAELCECCADAAYYVYRLKLCFAMYSVMRLDDLVGEVGEWR